MASTKRLLRNGQSLSDFANGHQYYGFHHVDGGWYYREWAPSADQLYLEGEFNDWNKTSHPLTRVDNENWEIYLPGDDALWHGCKVKTVVDYKGTRTEHFALYTKRAVQNKENNTFDAEVVDDKRTFLWTDQDFVNKMRNSIFLPGLRSFFGKSRTSLQQNPEEQRKQTNLSASAGGVVSSIFCIP